MSLFASVSPLQFNCVLFCTFLFGNKRAAPKAFAGLGGHGGQERCGRVMVLQQQTLPDWELAAHPAFPPP